MIQKMMQQKKINKSVFNYLFLAFCFYVTVSAIYTLSGDESIFWRSVYFLNENILIVNLLIVCIKLVVSLRVKYFAYIALGIKIIIILYDCICLCGGHINVIYWIWGIIIYYIISLCYYYVSSKRIYEQ